MIRRFLHSFWLILALLISPLALAGNPLYVEPDGTPLVWDTSEPIRYRVDPKGLGQLSFEQSLALIEQALEVWESVDGTSIRFEYAGTLDESLTVANWRDIAGDEIYAEGYGSKNPDVSPSQLNHELIIGFDNTGDIIADKGSSGASGVQSHTGILGTYEDPRHLISGHVFINGLFYNGNDSDIEDVQLTDLLAILIHELGHALGLDHSLFHHQMYQDIIDGHIDPDYARFLPTMFPRFIKSTGEHVINLHPDDIATLQWMYGDGEIQTISGNAHDHFGEGQTGLIVTARATHSSLCHAFSQATTITCGDLNSEADGSGNAYFNAAHCQDKEVTGDFHIPVFDEASYTLDIQNTPESFVFSLSRFDGFIDSLIGDAEFYNKRESSRENTLDYDVIVIDGFDSGLRDIVLENTVSDSQDNLERIDYTYFLADDFFATLEDETGLCPISNPVTIDLETVFIDTLSIDDSNNANVQTTSSAAAGCSLQTQNQSKQNTPLSGSVFSLLCLVLLLAARLNSRLTFN